MNTDARGWTQIGTISYRNPEACNEEGRIAIVAHAVGVRFELLLREDSDDASLGNSLELTLPVRSCESLVRLLQQAVGLSRSSPRTPSNSLEHIGTVNYKNRQTGEEGGVSVSIHSAGVHIGAYLTRDGDIDLMLPIADCRSLIGLLERATRPTQ
jgi:hypothetical protein